MTTLKKRRSISSLTVKLRNNKPVKWGSWSVNQLEDLRFFYKKLKWCKEYKNSLKNYENFNLAVEYFYSHAEEIITKIINNTKGLRLFMQIHSVFGIDDNNNGDWFVRLLIDVLKPTDKEVLYTHTKESISEEVLIAVAPFKPLALTPYKKVIEDIELHYKMWGDWKLGEQTDPIKIFDRVWESIGKQVKDEDIEKELSKYDFIDC